MKESWRTSQFRTWLAVIGAATLVLGAAYAMVQQSTRLAANDLPIAVAQSTKIQLENGSSATDVIPAVKTDLKNDSSVFVTVTDSSQHVLASSATLNNKTPLPPKGVFEYTLHHAPGVDKFTWQPSNDVRTATYVTTYKNGGALNAGFIITGQSLKLAEDRINTYGQIAFMAWLAILIWTSAVLLWGLQPAKRK